MSGECWHFRISKKSQTQKTWFFKNLQAFPPIFFSESFIIKLSSFVWKIISFQNSVTASGSPWKKLLCVEKVRQIRILDFLAVFSCCFLALVVCRRAQTKVRAAQNQTSMTIRIALCYSIKYNIQKSAILYHFAVKSSSCSTHSLIK